jgi:ectoine hydroxylase-related dioxygenase (phytanoyl-CoA dioxygenase family)
MNKIENFSIIEHIQNINNFGFTTIKNAFTTELSDKIISDFDIWFEKQREVEPLINKSLSKVTEFHTYNQNTLDLVTNEFVNKIITNYFNKEHVIYSSLIFSNPPNEEHQRITPHFYTNPPNQFLGVWYFLDNIENENMFLKYYQDSHLIEEPNNYEIYKTVFNNNLSYQENNLNSIILYNNLLKKICSDYNLKERTFTNVNKGDVIVFHPKLIYSINNTGDNSINNYCMFTNNIPINTQVFNSSHFFNDKPTNEYTENNCTFEYLSYKSVKYINRGDCKPQVQKTYL